MKCSKLIVTILLIGMPIICKSQVDFSGAYIFFEIAEKLKKDVLPSDAEWARLFNTPTYKTLSNWGRAKTLKNNLIIALMPSKKQTFDSIIKVNNYKAATLKHLVAAEENKNELRNYLSLLEHENLLDSSLQLSQKFLPNNYIAQSKSKPLISISIFEPDAYAGDSVIMLDLLFAKNYGITHLIAHEAHHFYLFKISDQINKKPSANNFNLLQGLTQLQVEGIADLINVEHTLKTNGGEAMIPFLRSTYIKNYLYPQDSLEVVDSLLKIIAEDTSTIKVNGLKISNALVLGSHPHGFFMAKTILAEFGRKGIIDVLSNPFKFIRLYNTAAKKRKDYFVFSNESMNYLAKLEKEVMVKPR